MDIFEVVKTGTIEELQTAVQMFNINQRDPYGYTPLMIAEPYATIAFLIQHGAEVNAQNNWGLTALGCAVQAPDKGIAVVELLIQHGANIHVGHPIVFAEPAYLPILVASGADVNAQNAAGTTRLMTSAACIDVETATFLLDHGANPHITDRTGRTALHIAKEYRKRTTHQAHERADQYIALLQAYGAQ